MATEKRLLELALQALEAQRDQLDQEIADLRQRITAGRSSAGRKTAGQKAAGRKKTAGRKMSAAQRKALSESMKKAWARRKKTKKTKKKR